ncbi:MAG: glycosyltransferase [Clostridia bacterium]|nr:glycosyltransferase [Clostridia bacterium]
MLVFIIIFSAFAAYGIICVFSNAIFESKHLPYKYIILGVQNQENSIEAIVRILMEQNPHSEIIVVDQGSEDSTNMILKKLCEDYPRIHISDSKTLLQDLLSEYDFQNCR